MDKDVKGLQHLLDSNFRAKVAKFGTATSAATSVAGPLLARHITGTQGYMVPEYVENGLKADVFDYGVVLLEILSGKEVIWVHCSMMAQISYWEICDVKNVIIFSAIEGPD